MKSLDAMLNMVVKRKGGRAVVGQAIEALREVFLAALLPDRKLRFLSQQPLAALPNSREGERRLLYWHLEDCIKKRYACSSGLGDDRRTWHQAVLLTALGRGPGIRRTHPVTWKLCCIMGVV